MMLRMNPPQVENEGPVIADGYSTREEV
jgi:hypothetical protein